MNTDVQKIFENYPADARTRLESLRELIFDVALNTDGVGEIEETLKWGEPSYLTSKTNSGTTIRINWKDKSPEKYALYVNCKTTLIDDYLTLFPEFSYQGNRAIIFDIANELPEERLRICIRMALRYHLDKKHPFDKKYGSNRKYDSDKKYDLYR